MVGFESGDGEDETAGNVGSDRLTETRFAVQSAQNVEAVDATFGATSVRRHVQDHLHRCGEQLAVTQFHFRRQDRLVNGSRISPYYHLLLMWCTVLPLAHSFTMFKMQIYH